MNTLQKIIATFLSAIFAAVIIWAVYQVAKELGYAEHFTKAALAFIIGAIFAVVVIIMFLKQE